MRKARQGVGTATAKFAITVPIAIASLSAFAAGYKLPETSTNATALSAAYVANADGPDASYYNPAAMALNADGAAIRADLTLVHLPSISFQGTQTRPPSVPAATVANDKSKAENIPVPTLHYVSPYVGNARFGLSMVSPGGLSKRWGGYGARSAEEFSLRLVEVNPTAAYRISDNVAIGVGVRMLYSDGVVKSTVPGGPPFGVFRDLEGDSIDFGYNLALHLEPTDRLALAATYRSKVDLTIEGEARLGTAGVTQYDGSAKVTIPLPAALALAAAFDLTDRTTVEAVFERTYWSAYKNLDFNYSVPLANPVLTAAFDNPVAKSWSDSNTIRFGVTHQLNQKWTLMGGLAFDESPAPKQTIGFELPESDGTIFSVGARYAASKQLEVSGAVLYTKRETLALDGAANDNGLDGKFSDAGALLVSMGALYRFD